jgi:hypothetical protein
MVADWLLMAGFAGLIIGFFGRKRRRTRWARLLLGASGIIGLAYSATYLALHYRWLTLTEDKSHMVYTLLHRTGGLLLGFLLSITFAGEVRGEKRDTTTNAPTI